MILVHIGAGAGDKDPGFNYRDGFTEFAKKIDNKDKKIYLVEANPNNINKLEETWQDHNNICIINKAIVPNKINEKLIKLYFCEDDAPNFQVMSASIDHVRKHYPKSEIKYLEIETIKISDFLSYYFKNKMIESLSIDIEGLDFDVIMDIDLDNISIKNISFEYLHFSKLQKKKMINHLISKGYSYNGFGIDHNNFDWLFTKKKSLWNNIISIILPNLKYSNIRKLNKFIFKL